jgi:hypothetical protein
MQSYWLLTQVVHIVTTGLWRVKQMLVKSILSVGGGRNWFRIVFNDADHSVRAVQDTSEHCDCILEKFLGTDTGLYVRIIL